MRRPAGLLLILTLVALAAWPGLAAVAAEPSDAPATPDGVPAPTDRDNGEPVDEPTEQDGAPRHIERLIEQLGAEEFFAREQAERELARLGFAAYDALLQASYDPDLEVAARARRLLGGLRIDWVQPGDSPAVWVILDDYELLSPQQRRGRMEALAERLPEQAPLVLARMVRHERSAPLSKQAALLILRALEATDPPREETIAELRRQTAGRGRTAARWIDGWLGHRTDRAALIEQFARWIDQEQKLLEQAPEQTSRHVVGQLMRMQIEWLRQSGQLEPAMALTRRLLEMEQGTVADLRALLQWLIEQENWAVIAEAQQRFARQIGSSSRLLYLIAEAQRKQGHAEQAEQTADRAYNLRLAVAAEAGGVRDWRGGCRSGAESIGQSGEFEDVFEQVDLQWGQRYAELLHDQGQHLHAAEVIDKLLAMPRPNLPRQIPLAASSRPLRARAHYFRACDHRQRGQRAEEKREIEAALTNDPMELDSLILRYRLPEQSDAYRKRTLSMIQRAAGALEHAIERTPDDPSSCNQYAWLIANTEGDLDKALRYSLRSLELRPNTGSYLDTLAHVYFAQGEYAEAVARQTRAAEREPHSKLIADKLVVFREALQKHSDEQPPEK